MKKQNIKLHLVKVTDQESNQDLYVCASYDMDESLTHRGFEFSKVLSSIPVVGLSIPSSRQATFKEEIHVLSRAAQTDKNENGILEDRIQMFIETAYDDIIKTRISEINQTDV